MKMKKFIGKAVEMGAEGAAVINTGSVSTAAWVRMKCRYGCGGYNSSHCCPPKSPTPAETQSVLDCYSKALLIHCKANSNVKKIVLNLERMIFLDGYHKALGFGAGPCNLCKKCDMETCKKPEIARPSMEACGIDVFATARANGFPINVVRDDSDDQNYYGLVLIE